jgi:hypothetical protein
MLPKVISSSDSFSVECSYIYISVVIALENLLMQKNLLEKQGSAPGAQEALVLAVASVVGARGA